MPNKKVCDNPPIGLFKEKQLEFFDFNYGNTKVSYPYNPFFNWANPNNYPNNYLNTYPNNYLNNYPNNYRYNYLTTYPNNYLNNYPNNNLYPWYRRWNGSKYVWTNSYPNSLNRFYYPYAQVQPNAGVYNGYPIEGFKEHFGGGSALFVMICIFLLLILIII